MSLNWEEFNRRLTALDLKDFDLIVAIGQGGIIPAAFIQQKLGIPMQIISIQYRDKEHNPIYEDAKLLENRSFNLKNKKILLVDDVSRTGKTINKAKEYLKDNQIKTFVINGPADLNLFNEKECIKMPWK
ncbi:phosphoribosyltransferase [Candidatus Woesearchaeota archaeon]|nr:phosphoribosyltransferase [Candidatus Woesearchaeota archaeon]